MFEQAFALREEGAAVTLWSNGTGILNQLKAPPFLLNLTDACAYGDGSVLHVYRPAAE